MELNFDYVLELIHWMKYPEIQDFCLQNRKVYNICRNDSIISNIIRQKRFEYIQEKTDNFLNYLAPNLTVQDIANMTRQQHWNLSKRLDDVDVLNELLKRGMDPTLFKTQILNAAIGNRAGITNISNHNFADSEEYSKIIARLLQIPSVRTNFRENQVSNVMRSLNTSL